MQLLRMAGVQEQTNHVIVTVPMRLCNHHLVVASAVVLGLLPPLVHGTLVILHHHVVATSQIMITAEIRLAEIVVTIVDEVEVATTATANAALPVDEARPHQESEQERNGSAMTIQSEKEISKVLPQNSLHICSKILTKV